MSALPTIQELLADIDRLGAELDRRARRATLLLPYVENDLDAQLPIPPAVTEARLTKSYRTLMGMSQMPWGRLVVDSKLDRLEVSGIQSGNAQIDDAVWGIWQDNAMDLESKLAHEAALRDGRAHALIWPGDGGRGGPEITLDDATQMIVEYEPGSRRKRRQAMRRWSEDGVAHATLYRRDGVYKFSKTRRSGGRGAAWEPRLVAGEDWPVANPYKVVPVVELAVNRRLKPGGFAHARGEFEDAVGLIDRINLLTFLGLIVAVYMGFPLRGVIGEPIAWRILKDDDGQPIVDQSTGEEKREAEPLFDGHADSYFQLENPNARIEEFQAADRRNLSVFEELSQLAATTATPRHYFPMDGGISNVSEPTIRAFEGGMHAKVNASHKPSLGEGWEELLRIGGLMLEQPVEMSPRAELQWRDHESRSLGERADAALKLSQAQLPWEAVAEKALNFSQDEIRRWTAAQSSSTLARLLDAANTPPRPPVVPESNDAVTTG